MFQSNNDRGFAMTFNNLWSVSVMWSPGNYCTSKENDLGYSSYTAEVLIVKPNGESFKGSVAGVSFRHCDCQGYLCAETVAAILAAVSKKRSK